MAKIIFHIDLNAFYASAEEVLDPALAGKPVAVSGLSRRSVVSTANYLARSFGVHSAMPIQEALELCPQLIVVKGHFSFYEELSEQFIQRIRRITPWVEQASIDECYADMTEAIQKYSRPLDLAWQIQQNLFSDLHLRCSIGVAPNKFLAKMASDMKKPMGITVLRKQEIKSKLWPLSIQEMQGIGKKTASLLKSIGIETIQDLAEFKDLEQLRTIFGKNTQLMIDRANGISSDEIICNHEVKSLSQSTTFLSDIRDYNEICTAFRKLSSQLSQRLKEEGKRGSTLSISVRFFDFTTIVRSKKIEYPIQQADDLYEHAIALFDQNLSDETIRHIGIAVSALQDSNQQKIQMNLFEEHQTTNDTLEIVDALNRQLSHPSLIVASRLKKNRT